MLKLKTRKNIIRSIALIGVVINATYAIRLLKALFEPGFDNSAREVLISAIALEFGWAVILIWAMLKPLERRHLLLFTALPLALSNFLHSMNQLVYTDAGPGAIGLNFIVGISFAGLFVFAFYLGRPNAFKRLPSA